MTYKDITRKDWIESLLKIILPILENSATGKLKEKMPKGKLFFKEDQYLEALGRIICGVAPWIECNDNTSDYEKEKKHYVLNLIKRTLENITRTDSPDYISFKQSSQSLVDTAYLVQGLIRSPFLWQSIEKTTQDKLIDGIIQTRSFKPGDNNWLLFASMIEAFLLKYTSVPVEKKRLEKGVNYFSTFFYAGDGMYSDGITFSMDYYNSFVIHPMMLDILEVCNKKYKSAKYLKMHNMAIVRFKRFVEIQERTVSPIGTYPIYGRTQICRLGAFQALSYSIYKNLIPESLSKSQIKGALSSLLSVFINNGKNYSDDSILAIGINGCQTSIAESYVSYGSAYHICNFFLCLGISPTETYWRVEASEWTSLKVSNGKEIMSDHALHDISYRNQVINTLKKLIYLIKIRFR